MAAMPAILHGAYVLRSIVGGQDSLHPSDALIFLRKVAFDANGQAVVTDIQVREGARIDFQIFSHTTACTGTDSTSVFGTASISIKDGNICISRADVPASAGNEAPAVVSPITDCTSDTFLVMFAINQYDLAVL